MRSSPSPSTARGRVRTSGAALVVALCALALLSACSSSAKKSGPANPGGGAKTSASGSGGAGGATMVEVKSFAFAPNKLTVAVGTKVTWKFDDPVNHNVTADNGAFKSADLKGGSTYSFTFGKAGTYSYTCTIHPYMKATVTVK